MTAGPGPSAIEIRPVQPDGSLTPGDNAVLRKWRLRADLAAGTLEFSEDRAFIITPTRSLTFPLPSTGRPDAVRTVCIATYRWIRDLQTGIGWRLLFLDGDGRVLGQGRRRDDPRASQLWPPQIFEPLRSAGIDVVEQTYTTEKRFKQAHPDA